jgi:hypothetical protein
MVSATLRADAEVNRDLPKPRSRAVTAHGSSFRGPKPGLDLAPLPLQSLFAAAGPLYSFFTLLPTS